MCWIRRQGGKTTPSLGFLQNSHKTQVLSRKSQTGNFLSPAQENQELQKSQIPFLKILFLMIFPRKSHFFFSPSTQPNPSEEQQIPRKDPFIPIKNPRDSPSAMGTTQKLLGGHNSKKKIKTTPKNPERINFFPQKKIPGESRKEFLCDLGRSGRINGIYF